MDHGLLAIQLLDVPNTIFMLLCVCLIMLITPILAFFYEELLSRISSPFLTLFNVDFCRATKSSYAL
jgi:hypothetical protein